MNSQTSPVNTLSSEDRWEISDMLARYCIGLDEKDSDLLTSVFTEDAYADWGPADGTVNLIANGREEIITLLHAAVSQWNQTQHLCGTTLVTKTDAGARAVSYLQAQHVRDGTPGGDQFIIAAVYTDDVVRTDEGWKIKCRVMKPMWKAGNPLVVKPLYEEVSAGL